jgi:hypothetical protein
MLVKKWNAHDEEIALWVKDKRLHVFASHHEIYFDAWGRRIWRHKPTDGASTRPCVAVGTIEDPDTPCKDWLTGFLFSRSEAEGFSPADSSDATMTAVDYVPYSDAAPTGWINPSGRYLTYQQAIHFLGRFESDAEVIAAVVRREFDRGALVGRHPFADWTNCAGLPKERIGAEDSLFMEGQIVGLAVEEFEADISRWDTVTRPDAPDGVGLRPADPVMGRECLSILEPDTGMDYFKADYWEVREAAILLLGYTPVSNDGGISAVDAPPLEPGDPDRVEAICELVQRAMDARDLPFVSKRKKRWIKPVEFLNWAQSKGYSIPQALISALLVPHQETETARAPQQGAEQRSENPDSAHEKAPTGQPEAADNEETAVPQQSSKQGSGNHLLGGDPDWSPSNVSPELPLEGYGTETKAIPHSDAETSTTADQKSLGRPPKPGKLANRLKDLRKAAREIVASASYPRSLNREKIATKLMKLNDWKEYEHSYLVRHLKARWWEDLK